MEEIQFDHKSQAGDLRAQRFGEMGGCFGGASGGEQVIHNDDPLSFLYSVAVNFERVGAVFKGVIVFRGGCREFSRLADGNKSCVEPVGHGGSENKSAGLHAQYEVYVFCQVVFGERVD